MKDLSQLFERIREDSESDFTEGASEKEIKNVETSLGILLPTSYVSFLREFNGGEFRFARMHKVSERGAGFFDFLEQVKESEEHVPGVKKRKLIPFGDDYGGNLFCFDYSQKKLKECPIVMWDQSFDEDMEAEPVAKHFEEFLEKGLEQPSDDESEDTLEEAAQAVTEETPIIEYTYDELLEKSLQYRERLYRGLGIVLEDEAVGSIIPTRFTDLPQWPSHRESYVRIDTDQSTILVSDGLSDPFEGEVQGQGFEVEVVLESADPIESMLDSWQFQILRNLSLNIAAEGNFREAFEVANFTVSYELQDINVPSNFKIEGRVGVLLGMTSCFLPEVMRLPSGNARLIIAKLLTKSELKYIQKHGADGRAKIKQLLFDQGFDGISFLDRESVI